MGNLVLCGCFVIRGILKSRAARKRRLDHKVNALEQVLWIHIGSLAFQGVAFSDINGFGRTGVPPLLLDLSLAGAHLCCELVIFKYCVAYRNAIDGIARRFTGPASMASPAQGSARWTFSTRVMTSLARLDVGRPTRCPWPGFLRRYRFECFGAVAAAWGVALCLAEIHPGNERGCVRTRLNLVKHLGRGGLEVAFMLESLKHGLDVRARLMKGGCLGTTPGGHGPGRVGSAHHHPRDRGRGLGSDRRERPAPPAWT